MIIDRLIIDLHGILTSGKTNSFQSMYSTRFSATQTQFSLAAIHAEGRLSFKYIGLLFLNHFHVFEKIVSFLLCVHGHFLF